MLLLLTLVVSPTPTTAAQNTTTTTTTPSCPPASCGGLNITYPFWLTGTHPPECGYKALQVTCDRGNASLKNSFWQYQILNISYDESSFILATNVDLSDGTCNFELFSDASTDLGLAPFTISSQNLQLVFVYGCDLRERHAPHSWAPVNCTDEDDSSESFALLAGNYTSGDTSPAMPLPANCNLSSMMPVLGYEGATGADYQRLLKRGFLLEYTDDGCGDCTASGGQCRIDVAHDVSWCHCSDDDEQPLPYICG